MVIGSISGRIVTAVLLSFRQQVVMDKSYSVPVPVDTHLIEVVHNYCACCIKMVATGLCLRLPPNYSGATPSRRNSVCAVRHMFRTAVTYRIRTNVRAGRFLIQACFQLFSKHNLKDSHHNLLHNESPSQKSSLT